MSNGSRDPKTPQDRPLDLNKHTNKIKITLIVIHTNVCGKLHQLLERRVRLVEGYILVH